MHYSVLLKESIENLAIKEDGTYVDATVGYAGHSSEILKRLKRGFLFAFDADKEATSFAEQRLSEISSNFKIFHDNFSNLKKCLNEEQVTQADGFLFDLGVSSPQIDEAERGFSFMREGNLDMRMDRRQKLTASDIVNHYSEAQLADILVKFGEEKPGRAKMLAREIVHHRPVKSTKDLADIIIARSKYSKTHPAARTFQAIRIAVNDELGEISRTLPLLPRLLKPNGRVGIITFHSLEDRLVKDYFKEAFISSSRGCHRPLFASMKLFHSVSTSTSFASAMRSTSSFQPMLLKVVLLSEFQAVDSFESSSV